MAADRTAGEEMFEAYLVEHGQDVPEHEPDLGVTKRPDYVIERDGRKCVCEVKEFAPDTSSLPGAGTMTSAEVVLKPIRSQIREAARQLKPLASSGLPLVVVITNPHGAWVETNPEHVIYAMYGDPAVRFNVNTATGAAEGDPLFVVDRNGKLRGDHQYVSALTFVRHRRRVSDFYDELAAATAHLSQDDRVAAIVAAEDGARLPEGSYHSVDVFRTLSPTAVPLPEVFFDGPHDRLFGHDPTIEVYRQLRGQIR